MAAIGLAVGTFASCGRGANAVAWAAVQLVLVAVAATDVATRRIPNALILPTAVAAVAARALFDMSALAETLVAAAACLAGFLAFALLSRGALGMGDVKLAGLLGLLLGSAVVPALLLGTVAGAVASLLVAWRTGSFRTTIAYGPYLCLGAAVAIIAVSPPALI